MAGAAVAVTVLGTAVVLAPPASAATFIVTNLNDSGPGSLRAAIVSAQANPGDDMIIFGGVAIPGTITLQSGLPAMGHINVVGPGAENVTIDGGGAHRVFDATGEGLVRISGFTVTNGWSPVGGGGGVYAGDTSLTLVDMVFVDNASVTGWGGAVAVAAGALTITDSTFLGNTTGTRGGAVSVAGVSAQVSGSTFANNFTSAVGEGEGGALYLFVTTANVTSTSFVSNSARIGGGAIAAKGTSLTIDGSSFDLSGAREGSGGAIHAQDDSTLVISDSSFTRNEASGDGGAISAETGTDVSIERTTLSQSEAGNGGALSVTANDVFDTPEVPRRREHLPLQPGLGPGRRDVRGQRHGTTRVVDPLGEQRRGQRRRPVGRRRADGELADHGGAQHDRWEHCGDRGQRRDALAEHPVRSHDHRGQLGSDWAGPPNRRHQPDPRGLQPRR